MIATNPGSYNDDACSGLSLDRVYSHEAVCRILNLSSTNAADLLERMSTWIECEMVWPVPVGPAALPPGLVKLEDQIIATGNLWVETARGLQYERYVGHDPQKDFICAMREEMQQ